MANLETSYCCTNPTSIDSDSSETGSVMSNVSHGTDDDSKYTTKDDKSDAIENDYMEDDVPTVKLQLSHHGNRIIDFFSLQQGLQSTCYCKQCDVDDWDSFLLFCDKRIESVQKKVAKKRDVTVEIKLYEISHHC
jgi:hypothetical protein